MEKAMYKIVRVDGYRTYNVYKRGWVRWRMLKGRDNLRDCEAVIREDVALRRGECIYFDAEGNRATGGQS